MVRSRWSASRRGALLVGALAVATALLAFAALRLSEKSVPPALARGAELYNANCITCHGGATGGGMMDYPPRHNASGHTWHHSDCELREIVRRGSGEMGELMRRMMNVPSSVPRMPSFDDRLSDEEIGLILDFIKSWWTDEQRAIQAQITRESC